MASTYLKRTPAGAGDSNRIFTLSFWFKRANLSGAEQYLFECNEAADNNDNFRLIIGSGENLTIQDTEANVSNLDLRTNRLFRDTSAWYHLVLEVDTTQATSSNRAKLYINGVQETSFSTETYPSQNYDTNVSQSGEPFIIGRRESTASPGSYFDGSMTHYHFIDGTAYDADTFGQTDATTGIWKPKTAPSVTYGTNGFFLKFENSGSMGTDSSGNANNFTVNGTLTQTVDTPSNVFCTLNALNKGSNVTLSNGNTTATCSLTNNDQTYGTLGFSKGKWYWEIKYQEVNNTENAAYIGFVRIGESSGQTVLLSQTGTLFRGTASGTAPSGFTDGDILGLAVDADNLRWYIYKNGVANGDYVTFTNATGDYIIPFQGNNDYILHANFGNGYFGTTAVSSAQNPDDGIGIFEYDVPAGYRALCTKSINAEEYS